MGEKSVKQAVLDYIRTHPGTSYVELEGVFEEVGYSYQGGLEIFSTENEAVIFWSGWNEKACEIIAGLMKDGKIEREPCHPYIYLIDGKMLRIPILKGNPCRVKRPHWLPCVFNAC